MANKWEGKSTSRDTEPTGLLLKLEPVPRVHRFQRVFCTYLALSQEMMDCPVEISPNFVFSVEPIIVQPTWTLIQSTNSKPHPANPLYFEKQKQKGGHSLEGNSAGFTPKIELVQRSKLKPNLSQCFTFDYKGSDKSHHHRKICHTTESQEKLK